MIREHAGAVEADLAFRGIDLRDFWLPFGGHSRLSWRRLLVLARGLPYDSATRTSLVRSMENQEAKLLASRRDHYSRKKAEQEVTHG